VKSVIEEALELVNGSRQESYGDPSEQYGKLAEFWSVILSVEVTAENVVHCLLAMKLCREINKPGRDNRVDLAGYAEVLDQIVNKKLKDERDSGIVRTELSAEEVNSLSKVPPAMTGGDKNYFKLYQCAHSGCRNRRSIGVNSEDEIILEEFSRCSKCGSNAWLPVLGDYILEGVKDGK